MANRWATAASKRCSWRRGRHGNLAGNSALFIAAFALYEMTGGDRHLLAVACAVFTLARLLHAVGLSLSHPANALRFAGTGLTALVGMFIGARLLWTAMAQLGL